MLHWLEARLALLMLAPTDAAAATKGAWADAVGALRADALVLRRMRELDVGAVYCPGVYIVPPAAGGAGDGGGTPDDSPTLSPLAFAAARRDEATSVLLLPPLGVPSLCLVAAACAVQVR
jgi:hypothetical protein